MKLASARLISVFFLSACAAGFAVAQTKPGPGPGSTPGPAPSQKSSPTFLMVICNKATAPVLFVAIGSRVGQSEEDTRVRGWWQVPQGQCVDIDNLLRP